MGNTLTGRIVSLVVGGNSITNCKYLRWWTNHIVIPRFLPSSKVAVGYLQGHINVGGEFGLLTYDTNLVAPSTADGSIVSLVMTTVTTAGATRTFTFTGAIIASVDKELSGGEPIFIYHFLAYYVTET